jgi:hypothetical protein
MIADRFAIVSPLLDERARRLVAAAEAQVLGHGGVTAVSNAQACHERRFVKAWTNWSRLRWTACLPVASGAPGQDASQFRQVSPLYWMRSKVW